MSSFAGGDGRTHIKSAFMRESLVSQALNEGTDSGEIRRMAPDVHFIAVGGRSIMDRGREALFPLVEKFVELKGKYKFVIGVGGGARARHTFAIGLDLGLPVGGLARIMGGVEEQNRDMLQFLLAPHGGITFIKEHFQDLQMFLNGGLIPVCIGQPPYHIWEPPPKAGVLPENGADVGLFLMAEMIGAASMILVKDVDGLYTEDPKQNSEAKFIPEIGVEELTADAFPDLPIERELARCLARARLVRSARIINGLKPDQLGQALAGENVGTLLRGARRDEEDLNTAGNAKAGG